MCIFKILGKTQIKADTSLKDKILDNTHKLKDLLTNTPVISNQEIQSTNLPAEVKNGIIHLSQERIVEIEMNYNKLKDDILLLQLSINKG